jgi:carbon-monoxide dehydrogenase large subunit
VRAVATGQDANLRRYGGAIADGYFLAKDKVRFIGEPVAALAAVDEDTASEALELIKVDYQELPPVFDSLAAMEPSAPTLHEELAQYRSSPRAQPVPGTNIAGYFKLRKGDIEQGLAQADEIFEKEYHCQKAQHCPMEVHNATAKADATGKLTVWTSTQAPFLVRASLCEGLGVGSDKVRVIAPYCGGGFGGKTGARMEPLAALLALKANGRPVKAVMTREEEFTAAEARHPCLIRIKSGIRKDGRISGVAMKIFWDTGAYALTGPFVNQKAGISAAGPYQIPNLKIDTYCLYTNTLPAGSFRGFGHPQTSWAVESHLDIMAAALGLEPLEIRLINGVEEGSISATGEKLHSVGLKAALKQSAQHIGWKSAEKPHTGRGIACSHRATAEGTSSSALIKLEDDGRVNLLTSTCELGQGSKTALAQIAAQELGIPYETVSVSSPDTDVTPFDYGTISSRSTFFVGNAVRLAAAEAKERLLKLAAERLEANLADLEIDAGYLFVKGSPDIRVSLAQLLAPGKHGVSRGYVTGRGFFTLTEEVIPDREQGQSPRPTAFWIYDAQAVKLSVDEETGEVNILKISSANEVGKAVNPASCQAQIDGCMSFALSCAMLEELTTSQGRIVNPSFLDYLIPSALDIPPITTSLIEEPHPDGPYGAKGSGENAATPLAPAIGNAIYNAVGVRILDGPITPEKVLNALKERKGK